MSEPLDRLQRAEKLIARGKLDEAKQLLKEVLADDNENAHAWYLVSRAVTNPAEQEKALERAFSLDPQHRHALTAVTAKHFAAYHQEAREAASIDTSVKRRRAPVLLALLLVVLVIAALGTAVIVNNSSTQPTFTLTQTAAAVTQSP